MKTKSIYDRILDWIEKSGNILPDPAVLFLSGILLVWVLSALENLKVVNLLGHSSTNIITPLSPFLPLVGVFAQRYVKKQAKPLSFL